MFWRFVVVRSNSTCANFEGSTEPANGTTWLFRINFSLIISHRFCSSKWNKLIFCLQKFDEHCTRNVMTSSDRLASRILMKCTRMHTNAVSFRSITRNVGQIM